MGTLDGQSLSNEMRQPRPRTFAAGFVLVLATLVAYVPAIRGGFIWDDDDYVTNNQTLKDAGGLRRIWFELGAVPQYYPLVHTTFWIEHRLWGLNPLGYHLVNVLLHATGAVLLWRALLRLHVRGAWFAAAVFALHPVHVESVAWITERKNVLSGALYLAATLAYLRFAGFARNDPSEDPPNAQNWRFYGLAVVLFICALLSKTVMATMPAAICLLLWWKRRLRWRDLVALAPLFVLGLTAGLLTRWMERHRVGAIGEEWNLPFIDRCLVAGRTLWFYAYKLICPRDLTFMYPRWQIDSGAGWQYLFPLGAIAVMVALWVLRCRIGRAPLVAVLFFAGTLTPALGFIDVYPMRYSFVADHFQYLASIGLIALFAGSISVAADRLGKAGIRIRPGFAALPLTALGVLVWRQGHIYKDQETLWRDTIAKNPGCWMARSNLGSILSGTGRTAEAVTQLNEALRLKPGDYQILNNLASALDKQGRLTEAVALYKQALMAQPNDHRVHNNLGMALARLGRIDEALRHFVMAAELRNDFADPQFHAADLLSGQGKTTEAIEWYRRGLKLRPTQLDSLNNLAWLLATRPDQAPGDANEAIRCARQACEATGYKVPVFLDTLGAAYAAAGRFSEAVATAQKAVELGSGAGLDNKTREIKERLELYKTGRRYTAAK
jgi:tetratricopeptide (TPR) repeat protein